jgi:hypothetical protein
MLNFQVSWVCGAFFKFTFSRCDFFFQHAVHKHVWDTEAMFGSIYILKFCPFCGIKVARRQLSQAKLTFRTALSVCACSFCYCFFFYMVLQIKLLLPQYALRRTLQYTRYIIEKLLHFKSFLMFSFCFFWTKEAVFICVCMKLLHFYNEYYKLYYNGEAGSILDSLEWMIVCRLWG